jgi:hypothetical protein
MAALRSKWTGNPLNAFLQTHDLSPTQLAIAAGTEFSVPYWVLNGYVRKLPQPIIAAIDSIDGRGAGAKIDRAYQLYREGLAHSLLMKA